MTISRRRHFIPFWFCLLAAGRAWGAPPEPLAARAWNEFGYQSFDNARRLFNELERAPGATACQRQEAVIGLAMVAQFDERRADLGLAEQLYRRVLADASLPPERRLLVESMLAETLAGAGRLAEADTLWDRLIRAHPSHVIAQDALIRRTVAHVTTFEAPETGAALAYLRECLAIIAQAAPAEAGMGVALERLRAWLHLGRKEYLEARAALMRLADLADHVTLSQGQLAIVLTQIARLSETQLDDPLTAGRYYRRLVEEAPHDVRAYFALTRAIHYGVFTMDEVRGLQIPGLTEDLLAELFGAGREEVGHAAQAD